MPPYYGHINYDRDEGHHLKRPIVTAEEIPCKQNQQRGSRGVLSEVPSRNDPINSLHRSTSGQSRDFRRVGLRRHALLPEEDEFVILHWIHKFSSPRTRATSFCRARVKRVAMLPELKPVTASISAADNPSKCSVTICRSIKGNSSTAAHSLARC